MFRDLDLQVTYSSYTDNLGEEFYSPVLGHSIRYDRATAYFSARTLANCSKGLEFFARKGHSFRLLVSAELSKDEFEQIKLGHVMKDTISESLAKRLRERLTLEEERNISNLSFLISIGVIDIRIAFTVEGIFHDKFGIFEDQQGDLICFRGSNNETSAAFEVNYEAFDITCSWQASDFDNTKITKSQDNFDKLWKNQIEDVYVSEVGQVIYQELARFDKGTLVFNSDHIAPVCFQLDINERLMLNMHLNSETILNNAVYKLRLKRYVDNENSTESVLLFKEELTYPDYKRIISILESDAVKRSYHFFTTSRLRKYIIDREMYIHKRANIGLGIKNHNPEVIGKFEEYCEVVNHQFSRRLRECQMWDSFFMCTMKKSSNFSVPGSGKTASVLGVFAYLRSKGLAKKIIMVGPKNSFGSWSDEFKLCFGNKLDLRQFSIQDSKYKNTMDRRTALLYDTGDANLILINYDSLRSYSSETKKLIDDQTLLVFDEVHKVKAIGGSNAAKALEISRNAFYTIALTGTPLPNSYTDIRNLLDILYYNEYKDFFGFSIQQLKNPSSKDIETINEKLQPFFCRTTKKQLSVPDVNPDIIRLAKATSAENRLFNILCSKYAKKKLVLIIRLLQLESNPELLLRSLDLSEFEDILNISGEIEDIDYVDYSEDVALLIKEIDKTAKFRACIDAVMSLIGQGKSIIVWCIFVDSIHRIAFELIQTGVKVGCIHGETSMEERQIIIEKFQDGRIDVLITNPHTLAESVSLHKSCHDAIYFEYSYNLVHLLQSKDRIHRLGLPEGQYTQYYYMQESFVTADHEGYSLDEQILLRLREKEDTMLNAIENNRLETVTSTQEDLDLIFKNLKLSSQ